MSMPVGPSGKAGNVIPKGYKASQLAQMTPEQMQLLQQRIGELGPDSYLAKLAGGDQSIFNQIEAPAMQQFSALQGGMASRFSGGGGQAQGGLSSRRSSGFQNSIGEAGSTFAMQLQAQRQQLQQQAIRDLQGLSGQLLGQRPYETSLVEKQQKGAGGWGAVGGAVLGGGAGLFLSGGNPMMGLQGAKLGSGIGGAFD
jgi:hypothetical protein